MSLHDTIHFSNMSCMNYRLDAFNYIGSLVPYVSMFFLPIITPGRQHWHLSLSSRRCRLDQCSLFAMICWTLTSFFFFFTLSCNRINPYPLHCAVYPWATMSFLYFTPFHTRLASLFASFRHCFLNHTFQSPSPRIISLPYLCRPSSFPFMSK